MRFLCSFAWADDEVQSEERVVLDGILEHLGLTPANQIKVESWLDTPPDMAGFDFGGIPQATRELFLDLAFSVASAHGGLAVEEMRHLQMFMNFVESPRA